MLPSIGYTNMGQVQFIFATCSAMVQKRILRNVGSITTDITNTIVFIITTFMLNVIAVRLQIQYLIQQNIFKPKQ